MSRLIASLWLPLECSRASSGFSIESRTRVSGLEWNGSVRPSRWAPANLRGLVMKSVWHVGPTFAAAGSPP